MTHKVEDLELSVRTANVLRNANIYSIPDFMLLTRVFVLTLASAGPRTWREVSEVQKQLSREGQDEREWQRFRSLVSEVNIFMCSRPVYRTVDVGHGFLVAVKCDDDDAAQRLVTS